MLGGTFGVLTDLQERVLFLGFQPVGTKELETALSLGFGEAVIGALEERKNVIEDDGFEINLVLVVEILGFEFNLMEGLEGEGRDGR